MNKIIVSPDMLEVTARYLEDKNEMYRRQCNQLFEVVNNLSLNWQGKDNQAFTNKINEYRMDFEKIALLVNEYSSFLRTSSQAYRSTQDELLAQARCMGDYHGSY